MVKRTRLEMAEKTSPSQQTSSSKHRIIQHLAIRDIAPSEHNPRRHNRQQIRAIATSIDAFGFNVPILVDGDRRIVAGHGRYEAAKLLGYTHVPAIQLDHLNPDQAKAFMLADNKLTDRSSWDDRKLAEILKELTDKALNFEMEATGFELPEIDLRVQSLDGSDIGTADDFDPIVGPAVSQCGDLWMLGPHRIYCGSALDSSSYKALLGEKKASAIFTDPPYNVRIDGHVSGNGSVRHREFSMASGEMDQAEFTRFLTRAIKLVGDNSVAGAVAFVCMDFRHMSEVLQAGEAVDLDLLNLCVWVKSNGGMGSFYRSRHELVFVFRNGSEQHRNNVQLGRHGRNRTNVWHYDGANSFARKGKERPSALHPTVKPTALVADAILDCTIQGEIVLDPFLGSGTTVLAAERTGRHGYGIELDPLYVDTAIQRWQRLTRQEARHSSGATYQDLSKIRKPAP
jgi:DNA modification methylase